MDTSLKRIFFEICSNFNNSFLTSTNASNPRDVRLCWEQPGRPKPSTHAPCNFRLESVPLPRLSLLPLLSKVTATSPACSHEKTPPITHIIRRSETVGKKTQQPSRSGALVYGEKRSALRPAYLPDFQQVISRFRSVVVSHNFLPSVYSSHATYTRHFRSTFAAHSAV